MCAGAPDEEVCDKGLNSSTLSCPTLGSGTCVDADCKIVSLASGGPASCYFGISSHDMAEPAGYCCHAGAPW
jgi:hypothetical protein